MSKQDVVKLTKEQTAVIQRQGHQVRSCLSAIRHFKFTEGDFLIKKQRQRNNNSQWTWVTEVFNQGRKIPRKYKVVAVDEFGIPFVRKVMFNGKLQTRLIYMGNQDSDYVKYEVDPDMQYHVILGGEEETFDPQSTYRQLRHGIDNG